MNRIEALAIVQKHYAELSDMNRDMFAELANTLLQTNYFIEKKVNVEEFRFLIANAPLFSAYFSLIDIDFGIDQTYHYAYLKNAQKHSKLSLNLLESQVLLSLRYLYQMKFSEVTLSEDVAIYYSELNNELKRTGAIKDNVKKGDIKPILRKYRDFNLIDYIANDITENSDARITIYPTILTAVKYDDFQELLTKYESYKKSEKEDEETDED